jgi:uncharacterized protein YifN (PemK superfamily)
MVKVSTFVITYSKILDTPNISHPLMTCDTNEGCTESYEHHGVINKYAVLQCTIYDDYFHPMSHARIQIELPAPLSYGHNSVHENDWQGYTMCNYKIMCWWKNASIRYSHTTSTCTRRWMHGNQQCQTMINNVICFLLGVSPVSECYSTNGLFQDVICQCLQTAETELNQKQIFRCLECWQKCTAEDEIFV